MYSFIDYHNKHMDNSEKNVPAGIASWRAVVPELLNFVNIRPYASFIFTWIPPLPFEGISLAYAHPLKPYKRHWQPLYKM